MLSRRLVLGYVVTVAGVGLASVGCEKVPLLAPSGSTITLTASTTVLSANGSTTILAQVLEAAGTPPHSGTHIVFTTTLGRVEPVEALTDVNGRATVTFFAGSNNGTATISAASGGAASGANGSVKISLGTAAVGRVTLSANPSTIPSNGGSSVIAANVLDVNGSALLGVPVTFATSAGVLASGVENTDAQGVARTTLTTSVQATVTATVGVQSSGTGSGGTGNSGGSSGGSNGGNNGGSSGGSAAGQASASVTVNVNPVPTVSITPPTGTLTAQSPIVFSINVSVGTNSAAQIKNVRVEFGDGDSVDLGAASGTELKVSHQYRRDDTYSVRVTVLDTLGGSTSAATVIVVQPEPPLSVTISTQKLVSGGNTTVTFTATVTPATATVQSYLWDFQDGPLLTTSSNEAVHTYLTGSPVRTVTVTVRTTTGQSAVGQTAVAP